MRLYVSIYDLPKKATLICVKMNVMSLFRFPHQVDQVSVSCQSLIRRFLHAFTVASLMTSVAKYAAVVIPELDFKTGMAFSSHTTQTRVIWATFSQSMVEIST